LDGAGSNIERIGFCFFSKASAEFCSAIVDRNDPHAASKLERHVGRIDDLRLRRALEAAIDFGRPEPPSPVAKRKNREDLWKGLRQR
jgi:hypothetical protein